MACNVEKIAVSSVRSWLAPDSGTGSFGKNGAG